LVWFRLIRIHFTVTPGLDPGVWIAGSSPAMTVNGLLSPKQDRVQGSAARATRPHIMLMRGGRTYTDRQMK
jgi:hypothetical protein